jgi:hypothetical protein
MCYKWRQLGKRLGYPECCVEAFVERNMDIDNWVPPSRIQLRIGNETGFIPCSYCAWKVLSKQCNIEDLIKNRKERKPFPKYNFICYGKMCK